MGKTLFDWCIFTVLNLDLSTCDLHYHHLHHPLSVWPHRWHDELGNRGNVPWTVDQPAFTQVDLRGTTCARTDIGGSKYQYLTTTRGGCTASLPWLSAGWMSFKSSAGTRDNEKKKRPACLLNVLTTFSCTIMFVSLKASCLCWQLTWCLMREMSGRVVAKLFIILTVPTVTF